MHNGSSQNGHAALATPSAVTHDLLDRRRSTSNLFRGAAALFAVLFVLGVIGFVIRMQDGAGDTEAMVQLGLTALRRRGAASAGDRIVVFGTMPVRVGGTPNLIAVRTVPAE